jgi:hypothetical protein
MNGAARFDEACQAMNLTTNGPTETVAARKWPQKPVASGMFVPTDANASCVPFGARAENADSPYPGTVEAHGSRVSHHRTGKVRVRRTAPAVDCAEIHDKVADFPYGTPFA